MINKRVFFLAFVSVFCLFLSVSCKKNNGQLEMPAIAPEELSPRISWALISDPYVACRKEADYESVTVSSFRKGEIYEIKGNCTIIVDEKKELWYAVGEGWIPSTAVRVFSNRLKAENAKKALK